MFEFWLFITPIISFFRISRLKCCIVRAAREKNFDEPPSPSLKIKMFFSRGFGVLFKHGSKCVGTMAMVATFVCTRAR